jgi:hypothetical protein
MASEVNTLTRRDDLQSSNAKFRSRSHDAVIRVYDEAGNVMETHEATDRHLNTNIIKFPQP